MTRREELLEQYEDALFTLLMDDFAASEGAKALEENERLKTEAEIVPLPVQQRCMKFINRYYNKQNLRAMGRTAYKFLNKVAMVTLVAVVSFSTAFAASPTFRANTLNMVIEVFNDHTEFRFETSNDKEKNLENMQITCGWLPTDWEFISENGDRTNKWREYETSNGTAEIYVCEAENSGIGLDTENAETCMIKIKQNDAMMIVKGTTIQLAWENEGVFWIIYGENVSQDDLIRIAENISLK